jgi:molybdenum cofactor biosynthesis protein B
MAKLDDTRPFIAVRIAVLTVSDTRKEADDTSGNALAQMIRADGHVLAAKAIVRDDVAEIRARVEAWIAEPAVDVIILTGGTGFTGRDVTPEAVKPLFEKEVDGFSTIFHMLSFEKIGTSTIQSRACAGLTKGTYIFCLPGSPGACKDAWNGILKWQLDNRHRPCNFVEIMPRLEEHRRPG